MKKFKINKRIISSESPAYIIAEIGMNHNGDIKLAKEMIRAAARAGADAVKFQSFRTEDFLSEKYFDFKERKKYELSYKDHIILANEAKRKYIDFFSTPLDKFSLDLLNDLSVPVFKIASCDLNNIPFIELVAKKKKPVIFSTGYASIDEIHKAYQTVKEHGSNKIIIMHCIACYPTEYKDINLKNIEYLKSSFPEAIIGFSDHSTDYLSVPSTAVALGARVIEKHFTLDQELEGYDHHMSLNEDMFSEMVKSIRRTESTLGNSRQETGLIGDEGARVLNARRSLFWRSNLSQGTKVTEKHVIAKRPGKGIEPTKLDDILGKVLRKDVKEDTLVVLKDIE